MKPAISVRNVSKAFGRYHAVDDATFDVPFGAVTGFIGSNGSGKSTTMRMMVGLTHPSTGRVLIDGRPFQSLEEPRRTVGAVLDRLGAHPGLSGEVYMRLIATSSGTDTAQIASTLERVGLADAARRKLGTYSTGMKQRLAIAGALLCSPNVLVLDEPGSGLDPGGIRWLRELLRDLADAGAAVFVSTHQLAEFSSIVEHVVLIDNGRILAAEPAAVLLAQTGESLLEDAILELLESKTAETAR